MPNDPYRQGDDPDPFCPIFLGSSLTFLGSSSHVPLEFWQAAKVLLIAGMNASTRWHVLHKQGKEVERKGRLITLLTWAEEGLLTRLVEHHE